MVQDINPLISWWCQLYVPFEQPTALLSQVMTLTYHFVVTLFQFMNMIMMLFWLKLSWPYILFCPHLSSFLVIRLCVGEFYKILQNVQILLRFFFKTLTFVIKLHCCHWRYSDVVICQNVEYERNMCHDSKDPAFIALSPKRKFLFILFWVIFFIFHIIFILYVITLVQIKQECMISLSFFFFFFFFQMISNLLLTITPTKCNPSWGNVMTSFSTSGWDIIQIFWQWCEMAVHDFIPMSGFCSKNFKLTCCKQLKLPLYGTLNSLTKYFKASWLLELSEAMV